MTELITIGVCSLVTLLLLTITACSMNNLALTARAEGYQLGFAEGVEHTARLNADVWLQGVGDGMRLQAAQAAINDATFEPLQEPAS